ncbi:MAG: PIN domain-containing protein [Candidatus Omnitrophica bacterium]|nr:PIN domain-containing protein [Candidatus Omnitrophota bacterium]
MQLVVDANILLAAFLKEALTRELLLDSRLDLTAPEYLLSETLRHLNTSASIRKRIGLSSKEIEALFLLLTQRIRVFPETSYQSVMAKALTLAPHRQDAPYLALALILKAAVWSNDKGVKKQTTVTVYSTTELLTMLRKANDQARNY